MAYPSLITLGTFEFQTKRIKRFPANTTTEFHLIRTHSYRLLNNEGFFTTNVEVERLFLWIYLWMFCGAYVF